MLEESSLFDDLRAIWEELGWKGVLLAVAVCVGAAYL